MCIACYQFNFASETDASITFSLEERDIKFNSCYNA